MFHNILSEALKANYSFFILVVGIVQLIVMIRINAMENKKRKKGKKKKRIKSNGK